MKRGIGSLTCLLLAACAAPSVLDHQGQPGAVVYTGKVIGSSSMKAETNWLVNEEYTWWYAGVLGVAMAHATARPAKTYYGIRTRSGALYGVTAQPGFYNGDCVQFWVVRPPQAEAERSRDRSAPAIATEPLGPVKLERNAVCD